MNHETLPPEITRLLMDWYRENARDLPWRHTKDPYAIWVSEIMLQQTRVDTVIPYYLRFLDAFPTVSALADAPEEKLLKLWEGLGYYSRVRNMQKAAKLLVSDFNGCLPADYNALRALPGIGDYTAGAIASEAFDLPEPAVDGNVLRILSRILAFDGNIADTKTKKHFTQLLRAVYPKKDAGIFTQSLMELGAVVCIPNGIPYCEKCPIASLCRAHHAGTMTQYPIKPDKKARRILHRTVFVLCCKGRLAIRKRTDAGVLSGLWELPGTETALSPEQAQEYLSEHRFSFTSFTALPPVKHIFTHITWQMTCYQAECTQPSEGLLWVSKEELKKEYMLPTAYAKTLKAADF